MARADLFIRLGPYWSRFAPAHEGMEMLGTVQRGAQIGALARAADGKYVQVNGDWLQPLHTVQVEYALKRCKRDAAPTGRRKGPPAPAAAPAGNAGARPTAPLVVHKKRRIVQAPDDDATEKARTLG
jgi:hypothetical protein